MSRLIRLFLILALLAGGLAAAPTRAKAQSAWPEFCTPGITASGALTVYCTPPNWNGDLVLFAHGYLPVTDPLRIPEEQLFLPDGTSIPGLMFSMGYAFAATSYRQNGLAIQDGVADLVELLQGYDRGANRVYVVGVSEGGIITTLAIEQRPDLFKGGLATCGPIGDFRKQINYWGDFRAVFDVFFPTIMPGGVMSIPPDALSNWDTVIEPTIQAILIADLVAGGQLTRQLYAVTRAKVDPAVPETTVLTATDVLWYNIFATQDGIDKLGGIPYDNTTKVYTGSDDDTALNAAVERVVADPMALASIKQSFTTSGKLRSPLITLHNTGDPVVPYWHTTLYLQKVIKKYSLSKYGHIPALRYGHCNFTPAEALFGFVWMVKKATGRLPAITLSESLPAIEDQAQFKKLQEKYKVKK